MNIKNLILFPLLTLTLMGCNSTPEVPQTTLDKFYTSLAEHNYLAENNEGKFYCLGQEAVVTSFNTNPNLLGGLFKNSQGVFEYVILNGKVEVQGMSSPVKELDLYKFFTSPADLLSINKDAWSESRKTENVYNLNLRDSSVSLDLLEYGFGAKLTGYNIRNVVLTIKPEESSANYMLRYENSKSESTDINVNFKNIGSTKYDLVTDFVKNNQTLNKQTGWTNYQKAVFNSYEITAEPYFYSGYSLGLSLSFGYYNQSGILMAYDLTSSKEHVGLMGNELLNHGYKLVKEGDVSSSYEFNNKEANVNLKIELGYIDVNDLETEEEKVSCPNGYLQVVYSYGPSYQDADFADVNKILNKFTVSSASDPDNYIKNITITDYTEQYNNALLDMLKESGITPSTTELILAMTNIKFYTETFEDSEAFVSVLFRELFSEDAGFINSKAAEAKLDGKEYSGSTEIVIDRLPTMGNAVYTSGSKFINDDQVIVNVEIYNYNYEKEGCLEIMLEVYNVEAFEYM